MRQCLGIPPALRLSGPFASIGLTQRTLLGRLPPAASGQETPIVQGRCRQRRPRVQSRRCAEALPHLPTATCCPNARPHAGVRPPLEASLAPLLRPSGVVRGTPPQHHLTAACARAEARRAASVIACLALCAMCCRDSIGLGELDGDASANKRSVGCLACDSTRVGMGLVLAHACVLPLSLVDIMCPHFRLKSRS